MPVIKEVDYGTPLRVAETLVTLEIDGKAVTVPAGTSVMRAAVDAGVQVPLSSSVSSSLPLALYPAAERRVDALGGTVLPTVNLLRLGWVF